MGVVWGPILQWGLVVVSTILCWTLVCCACKAALHRCSLGSICNAGEEEEEVVLETAQCITPYPHSLVHLLARQQRAGLMGEVEALRFGDAGLDSIHLATLGRLHGGVDARLMGEIDAGLDSVHLAASERQHGR